MSDGTERDEEGQPLISDRQIQQLVSSGVFKGWVRHQFDLMLKSAQRNHEASRSMVVRTLISEGDFPDETDVQNQSDAVNIDNDLSSGMSTDDHQDVTEGIADLGSGQNGNNNRESDQKKEEEIQGLKREIQTLRDKMSGMETAMDQASSQALKTEIQALRDQMSDKSTAGNRSIVSRLRSPLLRNFYSSEGSLDKDTFALMTISDPCSLGWFLGFLAFAFQIILVVMIAIDQIQLGHQSSVFNIPFRVDNIVRVGQFLTIILCLATQSDVLSAIQAFVLLDRDGNWREVIRIQEGDDNPEALGDDNPEALGDDNPEAHGDDNPCAHKDDILCGAKSWGMRIFLPNSMKLAQGILVIFVSFVIIIQSYNIIDLLKDFAALMVVSETDNILFQLADMGYLGICLQDMASKVTDIIDDSSGDVVSSNRREDNSTNSEGHSTNEGTTDSRHSAFSKRSFIFVLLNVILFGVWIAVICLQENGTFFKQRYPNCISVDKSLDMFKLAKKHFFDDTCYGGPLNTLGCEFEGGDCIDFSIAYPLCKGDGFTDVQEKLENGECDESMNVRECEYDGAQCCPLEILNRTSFGDGICNGGMSSTMSCAYDKGDCNALRRDFPNCPLDEFSVDKGSSDIMLGNGICEGGIYMNEQCGWEYGDCNAGQIGQDVIFRGVSSALPFALNMRMTANGTRLMIGMYNADSDDVSNAGRVTFFDYDSVGNKWSKFATDLVGANADDEFGFAHSYNYDGSQVAIGSYKFNDTMGKVGVYQFNSQEKEWTQLGQNLPTHRWGGYTVDLSEDGSKLAYSSVLFTNGNIGGAGKIQVFEMNATEKVWVQMGQDINGEEENDFLGSFILRLDSSGSRLYFSRGYFIHRDIVLSVYEHASISNSTSTNNVAPWVRLGNDIPNPYPRDFQRPAISQDGNRIAIASYTRHDSPNQSQVQVFDFDTKTTSWNQFGPTLTGQDRASNFGFNVDMSSDATLLAISSLNVHSLARSIKLYRYSPTNPPHRCFSQVPYKRIGDDFVNILEKAEHEPIRQIFGLDMFLSDSGSKISVSGYDNDGKFGFAKVYNVDELFYPNCTVSRPEFIGNGFCDDYEPYYTEQCGWDGGDCEEPKQSLVANSTNCFVRKPSFVGDDVCDDRLPYNTKECNYDGGDCPELVKVSAFPDCNVSYPEELGNGYCLDRAPYNSFSCGFDGGDCLPDEFKPPLAPSVMTSPLNSDVVVEALGPSATDGSSRDEEEAETE